MWWLSLGRQYCLERQPSIPFFHSLLKGKDIFHSLLRKLTALYWKYNYTQGWPSAIKGIRQTCIKSGLPDVALIPLLLCGLVWVTKTRIIIKCLLSHNTLLACHMPPQAVQTRVHTVLHRLLLLPIPVAFINFAKCISSSHTTAWDSSLLFWTQKFSRILWNKTDTKIYFIQVVPKDSMAKTRGKVCQGGEITQAADQRSQEWVENWEFSAPHGATTLVPFAISPHTVSNWMCTRKMTPGVSELRRDSQLFTSPLGWLQYT